MPAVLVLLLSGTWLLSGALVTGTDPLIVAVGRTAVCCLVLTVVAASSRSGRADLRRAAARPGTVWLLGLLGFAGYAAGDPARHPAHRHLPDEPGRRADAVRLCRRRGAVLR